MKRKIIIKTALYIIGGFAVILLGLYAYANYKIKHKFIPDKNEFTHDADYINPIGALLNKDFIVCNEDNIFQYYNPQKATYSKGKYGIRKFILSNYKNKSYTDSGYLNIRFIINCKGEAGRYTIHQNNLDLQSKTFNNDLKNQLFNLTTQLKQWNPNFIQDEYRDSYMYISYRIENGEITEILP